MKAPFKVGDRAAVYTNSGRYSGEIVDFCNYGLLRIKHDSNGDVYEAHSKQCRRLRHRPPLREYWIDARPGIYRVFLEPPYNHEELVHVREVRPKKEKP